MIDVITEWPAASGSPPCIVNLAFFCPVSDTMDSMKFRMELTREMSMTGPV